MSAYTVTVLCPRCDNEITLEAHVSGRYVPASRWSPEEGPDVDFAAPDACTHTPDETEEFTSGPYTDAEVKALDERIIDEAIEADKEAQYDSRWDGPEDDE